MIKKKEKFNGIINGVHINDFLKCIDNSLTQAERLAKLEEVLYDGKGNLHNFFEELFSNEEPTSSGSKEVKSWFNMVLSQSDFLSDKNDVCNKLEMLASWLLFSPDAERITKKTKYNFYSKEALDKKMQREVSFGDFQSDEFDDLIYDEIIDFVVDPNENYRMEAETKITATDIREIAPVSDYQKLIDHIKTLPITGYGELRKLNKIAYEMKKDQKWLKDYLYGTIVFKHPTKDSSEPDFEAFDFFDKEHIQLLMKCSKTDLKTDVGCLLEDLDRLVAGAGFTKVEQEVYWHLRHNSKSLSSVANYMNLTRQYVSQTYNNIIKKIIKRYEIEYENWYYLSACKGKYKKCSRCGEIKLLTPNYFGKDSSKIDGFKYNCKLCDETY